ncbi:MAG: hypothetical protein MJE77_42780 [Proteobacteria bacterium]|nr:hypothetical protein [Pseudomonadota bacterium]
MSDELLTEYESYLERFEEKIGAIDIGSFVKYNSQLIWKLDYQQFGEYFRDYTELSHSYFESLRRGDTINDLLVRKLRELATKLVLDSPA